MDLKILEFLTVNDHYITVEANNNHLNDDAAKELAQLLLNNGGDISHLNVNQQFHYHRILQPLLEFVSCEGLQGMVKTYNGEIQSSCSTSSIIYNEDLLFNYHNDNLLCQICRYDSHKFSIA